MSEKLQKALARSGLGSRREIETWIAEGRLSINGTIANIGARVTIKDDIRLDGRKLRLLAEQLVNRKVLMYHKPEGQITTRKDPEGRDTVFENLPALRGSRWVAIGRLDLNTSGLLLFTNDGELANRLMHPKHEVVREYAVRIMGDLTPSARRQLQEGVMLEDGIAKFTSIESKGGTGSNKWYHVTLAEGRTREVRRMFEAVHLMVSRLIRVKYGPIQLDPGLKQAMMRELSKEEMDALCDVVGLSPQASRAERRQDVIREKGRLHSEEKQEEKAARRVHTDDEIKPPRLSKRQAALKNYEETKGVASEKAPRSQRAAPVLRESERKKIAIAKQRRLAAEKEESTGKFGKPKTRGASTRSAREGDERSSAPRSTRTSARTAPSIRSAREGDERSSAPRSTRTSARTAPSTRSAREGDERSSAPRSTRTSTRTASSLRSARDGDERSSAPRSTRTSARDSDERSFNSSTGKRVSRSDAPRDERSSRASSQTSGNRSTRTHAGREGSGRPSRGPTRGKK